MNRRWREGIVGVVGRSAGWTRVLAQVGVPMRSAVPGADPIIVVEGEPDVEVMAALEAGAVVVSSGLPGGGLLGPGVLASITRLHGESPEIPVSAPCLAWLYPGPGWGEVRRHEDRLVKDEHEPGVHALVHELRVGAGTLIATGVPLATLLCAVGDRLRAVAPSSEVTERIAGTDTAGVEAMLVRAFASAQLPFIRCAPFPDDAASVLVTRIDVDGDPDGGLARLLAAADEVHLPLSIYLNGSLTDGDALPRIPDRHEVGQHGWDHTIHDDMQENQANLQRGARYVEAVTGRPPRSFVGPRGMWNSALDEAAAAMGYEYGSEFGLAVDGHPFRTPAGLLQIPVHPYSPERASAQAEEEGRAPPSGECIIEHYRATFMRHLDLGRPIHVYGHPTRLGSIATRVCGELAHLASRHAIPAWTLGDYADWWRRRERAGLRVHVHARSGAVDVRFDDEPVALRGSGDGRFRLRSVTAGSVGLTTALLTGGRR